MYKIMHFVLKSYKIERDAHVGWSGNASTACENDARCSVVNNAGSSADNGHTRRVQLQLNHHGLYDDILTQFPAQFDPDLQPLIGHY